VLLRSVIPLSLNSEKLPTQAMKGNSGAVICN